MPELSIIDNFLKKNELLKLSNTEALALLVDQNILSVKSIIKIFNPTNTILWLLEFEELHGIFLYNNQFFKLPNKIVINTLRDNYLTERYQIKFNKLNRQNYETSADNLNYYPNLHLAETVAFIKNLDLTKKNNLVLVDFGCGKGDLLEILKEQLDLLKPEQKANIDITWYGTDIKEKENFLPSLQEFINYKQCDFNIMEDIKNFLSELPTNGKIIFFCNGIFADQVMFPELAIEIFSVINQYAHEIYIGSYTNSTLYFDDLKSLGYDLTPFLHNKNRIFYRIKCNPEIQLDDYKEKFGFYLYSSILKITGGNIDMLLSTNKIYEEIADENIFENTRQASNKKIKNPRDILAWNFQPIQCDIFDDNIFMAIRLNNIEVIKNILAKNPDSKESIINSVNFAGNTLLTISIQYRFLELAQFLLDHGADPNISILASGCSCPILLYVILKLKDPKFINILLSSDKLNVDAQDNLGNTALHIICSFIFFKRNEFYYWITLLNRFIERGANLNIKNLNGNTPYDFCCKNIPDNEELKKLLRPANQYSQQYQTPPPPRP